MIYVGPAGVVFTPDELLIIWAYLSRIPTLENEPIRERIHKYLEGQGHTMSLLSHVTTEGGDAQ